MCSFCVADRCFPSRRSLINDVSERTPPLTVLDSDIVRDGRLRRRAACSDGPRWENVVMGGQNDLVYMTWEREKLSMYCSPCRYG